RRLGDAEFVGNLAHAEALVEQVGGPAERDVVEIAHGPESLTVAHRQPRLERLGIVADEAAQLLEVNFEARALVGLVVLRMHEVDDGVEHVLALAGAALRAVLAGMMDDYYRDAAAPEAEQPFLHRPPALRLVLFAGTAQGAEVVQDDEVDAVGDVGLDR